MFGGRARMQGTLGLVSLMTALAACSDAPDKTGYEASCARDCERVHQCLSSVDVEQCAQSCESGFSGVGPHLRLDYLAGIDACVAELSCTELVVASITDHCARESRARLAASETAVGLCEAVDDSLQECLGLSLGTSGCIEAVKTLTDGSLLAATPCFDEPCDRRAACLTETVGVALFGG